MKRLLLDIQKLVKSRFFNISIFLLILLSAILAGIEAYPDTAKKYQSILYLLDNIIIICFSAEILLKIIACGKKPWMFFLDPWNVFDFIIVMVCLIPFNDTHFFAVLRIIRVLRILRMITIFPKLRLIISALLKSIPSMGYVILLIMILFYIYGIIGVFIFGKTDPLHFGDLHHALITLFKVLTLEGWTEIMNIQIFGSPDSENQKIISTWPFLYFSSFILIGAMIVLNLFIGVIMNSMEESRNELSKELKDIKHNDKNKEELYEQIISKLDELNNHISSFEKNKHAD